MYFMTKYKSKSPLNKLMPISREWAQKQYNLSLKGCLASIWCIDVCQNSAEISPFNVIEL